jgi:hypothetical protein
MREWIIGPAIEEVPMRPRHPSVFFLGSALAIAGASLAYQSPDLSGIPLFPPDNPWHYDISSFPVHPNSANLVASVGAATSLHPDFGTVYEGAPLGIPYLVVGPSQPRLPVAFDYDDESDPGPYPAPLDAPIEGGSASTGDRHVIVVDSAARKLYEMWDAHPLAGSWKAGSGAVFDLASNALRPETWTSADAAGLPILPGLVRYDEIRRGTIDHAIRMTVSTSRKAYLWPARHQAGSTTSANAPAMGERFRLKAGFDTTGFPRSAKVVIAALKKHGVIVADNGSNWFISGAPDERFSDEELDALKRIKGRDFEAVLTIDSLGNPLRPAQTGLAPRRSRSLRDLPGDRRHDALGRATQAAPGLDKDGALSIPVGRKPGSAK